MTNYKPVQLPIPVQARDASQKVLMVLQLTQPADNEFHLSITPLQKVYFLISSLNLLLNDFWSVRLHKLSRTTTLPSNKNQLRRGRQMQVSFIPFVDKSVKQADETVWSLTTRTIPQRFCIEVFLTRRRHTKCPRTFKVASIQVRDKNTLFFFHATHI